MTAQKVKQNTKTDDSTKENEETDSSTAEDEECEVYALVSNIPAAWHTHHLRRHFSDWVETDAFTTFHFRHRPEKGKDVAVAEAAVVEERRRIGVMQGYSEATCTRVHQGRSDRAPRPSTCCIVRLAGVGQLQELVARYHRHHWQDGGVSLASRCFVSRVQLPCPGGEEGYSKQELDSLPELRPPNIMPRGNVGTSTAFFLEAIRVCRLPATIIGKLKLEFPQATRKYGQVPPWHLYDPPTLLDRAKLARAHAQGPGLETVGDSTEDNDTCEEWERHEALHNDVQPNRAHGDGQTDVRFAGYTPEGGDLEQQAGTKERTLEDEVELVWEKGGSGLNFYTDASYWKAQEGDFDERNTDDWDVDMSVYYEKDCGVRGHDKDALDGLHMREAEFLRKGKHEESVFRKKKQRKGEGRKRRRWSGEEEGKVGSFESYNRGVAGRIMAAAGWEAGEGLGREGRKGPPTPVLIDEDESQGPKDKRGMGYHGERLDGLRRPMAPPLPAPPAPPGGITTCYTGLGGRDPREAVHRTNPPMYMKFRDQAIKFHRGGVEGASRTSKEAVFVKSGESAEISKAPHTKGESQDSGEQGGPSKPEEVEGSEEEWEGRRRMVELGGGEARGRFPHLGRIEVADLDF